MKIKKGESKEEKEGDKPTNKNMTLSGRKYTPEERPANNTR